MSTTTTDVDTLDAFIADRIRDMPAAPLGWPGEIEAALLDAVFSVRARYGSESSGVRAVVKNWRERAGSTHTVDDLHTLGATDPEELRRVVNNNARSAGRSKAAIAVDAAGALSKVGLNHASDFDGGDRQRNAYLSVKGCGPVTWSYFGMLLGKPDVKADTWIVRFVGSALGRKVNSVAAQQFIKDVAARRSIDATQLDHAIWRYARTHL